MAESKEANKQHVSIAVCGHVDSGKSTTVGHLLFELGGVSERDMQKLRDEAKAIGKDSFCFAFMMDKQKEERERGITIVCTTKEFFTPNYHYTIIDAPGHRDFIKNMISGSSQADVAILMVPADGGFGISVQKGNRKNGEIKGQTRQHSQLLSLLGVKQLIIGVNKMDSDIAGYSQARFEEVRDEMKNMLKATGWSKAQVDESIPIIPISGWVGDNLLKPSEKMPWWKGVEVKHAGGQKVNVHTLHDALDKFVQIPKRKIEAPLRIPISGVFQIKGVGNVICGKVEQGVVKPSDEVVFLPTHTATNDCSGKVFTIEMHHKNQPEAGPGDNIGMNIKGLDKARMPKNGDIMILKKDDTLKPAKRFTAQVQMLEVPNEVKVGYTPICFVKTANSACKIVEINWKIGKETGGVKAEKPVSLKTNEMAEIVLEPSRPFVVDSFDKCEGLSRLAAMDGGNCVMIGKITKVEFA